MNFASTLSPRRLTKFSYRPPLAYCNVGRRGIHRVIMVRHGESVWNQKNLFTGWYDSPLSEKGEKEAEQAGDTLRQQNYKFDIAFTSVLTRAVKTLSHILAKLHQPGLLTEKSWRLNERHYGSLTGLNKQETAKQYGEDQVQIWRRSYDTPPPPMDSSHQYYHEIVDDPRYSTGPRKNDFPVSESLKMTLERVLPFWKSAIVPEIRKGSKVLIVAHGNSLRGIVKTLDNMSEEAIMNLNLPTGIPFMYLMNNDIKPVPGGSLKYLGDPETVKRAIETVTKQGKADK